jgi:hypothetical protein
MEFIATDFSNIDLKDCHVPLSDSKAAGMLIFRNTDLANPLEHETPGKKQEIV